jgi:peptidoglycan hydrolase-like protein with peptidoglycan-binding domain
MNLGKLRLRGLAIIASSVVAVAVTAGVASASTTAASASHVHAAPSGCVTELFTIADENTYLVCVRDEQVLLNNLWSTGHFSPMFQITVDGYYGPNTRNDVEAFQGIVHITVDGETGLQTWSNLCAYNSAWGFTGVYWHDAGCATE